MPDEPQAPEEGKPEDAPTTPSEASGEASEKPDKPEYFSDTFDPASLPDELQPGYKQMRDAFSAKTQTIAEERQQLREAQEVYEALQDPDRADEVLARLGYEVGGQEEEFDDIADDPYEELRREVESLKSERAEEMSQRESQQLQQAEVNYVISELDQLASRTGREFTDDEREVLGRLSHNYRTDEGFPDVQAAYEAIYTGLLPAERERWVNSKNSPQAPGGSSAVEVPDLDNDEARQDYVAQRLAQIREGTPGN